MPRPTQVLLYRFRIRDCHPLWSNFPDGSACSTTGTGLVRVRSPLLTESRLMSFPPGTEMFQFPGFASPKPILFSLVIPPPFNYASVWSEDRPKTELNGEGGLSHSEIAGSKPAHGSPTLIAACHVLHRLYMPRHPPDALTSRLRVHTTNNNTGLHQRVADHADKYTQPDNLVCTTYRFLSQPCDQNRKPCVATASIKKPIHNVKERHKCASYHRPKPANRYSSSLEIFWSCCAKHRYAVEKAIAWHSNEPKVRKANRPPPLMRRKAQERGRVRRRLSTQQKWWSLSGSNR